MDRNVDPNLTEADQLILKNLFRDIELQSQTGIADPTHSGSLYPGHDDDFTKHKLAALKGEPVLFSRWNYKSLPFEWLVIGLMLKKYEQLAKGAVRKPGDEVFFTYTLIAMMTSVPSAGWLFYSFSWIRGILHLAMQLYFYFSPFTLLFHNDVHQNGFLALRFRVIDRIWPFIFGPLMGQTCNTLYYHHVKHHHVENNGPDDLSSTIRYQRDNPWHLVQYVVRFLVLVWIELPLYFLRKGKTGWAIKCFLWEIGSWASIWCLAYLNIRAAFCVLMVPLCAMRIGLMVGNFGQHVFVDDLDPTSDFRSSVTLIDVTSNRYCFNDGYHTSHHLNPKRHWCEHQVAFMKDKERYIKEGALIFKDIDFIHLAIRVVRKDYLYLADRMIPMGSQINLSRQERADLLRSKTKRFTEEDIKQKFRSK